MVGEEVDAEVLAGGGPADVVELTLALAREMLAGAGVTDVDPADKLADGSAMDAWKAMIRAKVTVCELLVLQTWVSGPDVTKRQIVSGKS